MVITEFFPPKFYFCVGLRFLLSNNCLCCTSSSCFSRLFLHPITQAESFSILWTSYIFQMMCHCFIHNCSCPYSLVASFHMLGSQLISEQQNHYASEISLCNKPRHIHSHNRFRFKNGTYNVVTEKWQSIP